MPDIICNTSPIQYLHQLGLLHLLPSLTDRITIPSADDALARRAAEFLGLRLTGTPGVLLEAKRKGVIPQVAPVLSELHALNFRVAAQTRAAVLKLAGE